MKRFLFLALSIPLLSVAIIAQTPNPSISTTPSPTSSSANPSPSPSPSAVGTDQWRLPYLVELIAVGIMLSSVFVVFWLVLRQQEQSGTSITPRHIQFVSVCLIVPTILILGLEQVLSKETTATLIGGLTGYLLSGLGRYEPSKPGGDDKTDGDQNNTGRNPGSAPAPGTPAPGTPAPVPHAPVAEQDAAIDNASPAVPQPISNSTIEVEQPQTAKSIFHRRVAGRFKF